MAKFVAYKQESMLPVYEEMKNRKLVSEMELREIIKKREELEYKLNKQTKTLKGFCEYIVYERDLLATMTEREKLNNPRDGPDRKFGPVENSIALHLKGLFKQALHLFPEEPRIWECYLKFCRDYNYYVEASNIYEKMLLYHGDEPRVWLRAIKWEFKEIGNMEKVKDLLIRSIQRHPEDEDLHLEFFKILLSETEKMSIEKDSTNTSERDLGLKRVEVLYKNSRQKICKVEYMNKILSILEEYSYTQALQKAVIEDMMNAFPTQELIWHTFALRELRGLNIADLMEGDKSKDKEKGNENDCGDEDAFMSEPLSSNENGKGEDEIDRKPIQPKTVQRTLRRRIELCCKVYESAVKTLKSEKMWSMYINTMLDLNRDKSTQQSLKRQKLSEAFKGAFQAELMSKDHFELYIELLKESKIDQSVIEEIMSKATTLHSGAVRLWELWMDYYVDENNADKVCDIFHKATKKLGSDAFPLWTILIHYYQACPELNDRVEDVFKEAVKFQNLNFLELRVQYLEWTLLYSNIEKTRKVYDEMVSYFPPYYEMHNLMALIESKQIKPDIERWRKCYENMIYFFGKDRTDIWISYIKFERDHGIIKNMSSLFERGKSTLRPELSEQFGLEYSYLSAGIM